MSPVSRGDAGRELWSALTQILPHVDSPDTLGTIISTTLGSQLGCGRVALILPAHPLPPDSTADSPSLTYFCRPIGPGSAPGDLHYLRGDRGLLAKLPGLGGMHHVAAPWPPEIEPDDPLLTLAQTNLALIPIPSCDEMDQDGVSGALCLLDVPPESQPAEVELIALASFTGVALQLIRQKTTAARQALEYSIISEIGRSLTSSLSLDDVFEQILSSVRAAIDASEISVGLIDQSTGEIVLERSLMSPSHQTLSPVRLKLGQGVAGWVAMTGQPLNVPDAYRDPRFFQGVDEASGFVTQSILCVPLTADGKVIGVLEAVNKHQGQFTAADERLLSALSSSAAIAIHKAHLHQNVVDEKRRMDAIIASMGEGLMTIAVDGRITTINPTLLGMIGTAPGEIPVGLDCRSVIGTEPAVLTEMLEEMAAHAGDRQAYQAPCDILRADGSRLPVLVSGGATTGPDGLASEIVVVFSDVCQLREIERMKDDFVANVTHELRTPLATILLYARLLRSGRTKGDPEREARYLGIIEQQSDQLQKLVRKILDLARMEATRSRSPHLPFRLQTLCAEVLPPLVNLAQAKGLTVQVRIPEHLPAISGDAEAMRLVLANLMDNAIKFTPQGKISVSARRRGDTVQLTVSDEGIGINPESVPHLFQRFYRTQTAVERGIGGTGLGLALVKEAVETLGGSIALRSQAGKGTVLAVRLPVCSSPESSD